MNKKVCSFPILFALLALLIGTCAVVFPASAQAAPTSTGSITVSGTVASSYDAYQIFSANVVDGDSDAKTFTDLVWASDAVRDAALPVLHSAGMPNSQTTAQKAAEWLNTDSHLTGALSAQLARSLQSSGAVSVALNAGTAAKLPSGYWLIVADDDAIAQGEVGTAPIMALVGGGAVTVKPKAATPKVSKHVLEDSTAAWQKAADATVADDLYWRLSATVPAGLTAYDTYAVRFVDTMGAGLDPSKVAASMRVYVAAGADGGFDAVSADKDGRVGTEPAKGWTDITAQCATKIAADGTFTVRTGDLIAALGGADAFTAGARVVAVYNAPLNSACNHGIAKGNPNEAYLCYPRSPFCRPVRRRRLHPHAERRRVRLHLGSRAHQAQQRRRQAACRGGPEHRRRPRSHAGGRRHVGCGGQGHRHYGRGRPRDRLGRGLGQAGGLRAQGAQGLHRL